MKWSKQDLAEFLNGHVEFEETISANESDLVNVKRIKEIPNALVKGKGLYDPSTEQLYLNFDIKGTVVVPCDITLEDVELPIHCINDAVYSFRKTDDPDIIDVANNIIDTTPTVYQLLYIELPIKVVKEGSITYPKGDNWEVLKEEDFEKSRQQQVDPRLAKLKEFKVKD